ncbi:MULTISPECIES: ExbD/TolR family protein [Vibrio]|jgi:biopolymer transport protein ExbD|uniref:Biopolymer transport ExbD/TolR family protein n=2 Tax=Vibrio harveyi group TaxID=717610 RepID=A0A3A1PXD9_VIBHA|nr:MULTISPECIES: biopolymer transporter ExbD [Vibrio]AMG01221.1 biopolymer transporter ExbD [Vibrio harveyi]APP07342.1 biopolymer transporter ExbD [Vibrio harveyi]EKM21566.1 biopolymer transport ExbD/TolR family protein [Vibrio harveyi]EKM30954.1 biopolymer transport ExbD/TolR family protein [Vibrio harveyi]EKO3783660.1 biopolymer transporter ExbD [Vibrio harveyi]
MIKAPQDNNSHGLTPDLTPLLDIIFIVMVFLMLTAAVKLDSLDVNLPSTDSQAVAEVDKQSITVNILKEEPHWAINGKAYIDWENFTMALLEESKSTDKPIVIGAEKTADIQSLVKLLGFLQENGIQATQLLTEESQ